MRLTTLMEILESEIGASPSARAKLAALVAERGQKESAAQPRAGATEPRTDGGIRGRSAARSG
jgi:phage terminase small subunit